MIIYEKLYKRYGLSASQQKILDLVGRNKVVLEIGPSTGYVTEAFLENGCIVDVVEVDKKASEKITKRARKILNYSIEDEKVYKILIFDYDYIVLADVLEHLIDPLEVLKKLFSFADDNTKLIISIPNIASWIIRKQLFFKGDFEYQESGPLDKTHLHFYTTKTLPKVLEETGWKIEGMLGTITRLPFDGSISRLPLVGWLYEKFIRIKLVRIYKNLSFEHFLIIAYK